MVLLGAGSDECGWERKKNKDETEREAKMRMQESEKKIKRRGKQRQMMKRNWRRRSD